MKRIMLVLSFFFSLLVSCQKTYPYDPYVIPPTPKCYFGCDTSKLDVVWQTPLGKDTFNSSQSCLPILNNGTVIFCRSNYGGGNDTVLMLDKLTGRILKTWNSFLTNSSIDGPDIFLSNGRLFFQSFNDVNAIDATSFNTIWQSTFTGGNSSDYFFKVTNGYAYQERHPNSNLTTYNSCLVRSKIDKPQWDTIFIEPTMAGYRPAIGTPAIWFSPNGDEIAIFQIGYANFDGHTANYAKHDLVAYNITKKSEYFRFSNIDSFYQGSGQTPVIVGNKAFVAYNDRNTSGYDLIAKKTLWTTAVKTGGFNFGQALYYVNNKVYVKPGLENLYELNADTGDITWQDADCGADLGINYVYYNGILYFTASDKLIAYDLATHKKLIKEVSPNRYPNKYIGNRTLHDANIGFGGVTIDTTTGYLYTSDGYFAMCIRLPK